MRFACSNRSAGVWLVLALIVVGFLGGNRARSGPVELGGGVAHEEAPSGVWMPRSSEIPPGVEIRCEPVVLGPYKSVQVNVDELGCNIPGDAANEPSIAIDPTNPRKMVIGWRQFDAVQSSFQQAGWGFSHDVGHTWMFPGSLRQGVLGSDPVLDADSSGNLYYHTIRCPYHGCGDLFKSANGGITWTGPVVTMGGDKPWMAIDRTSEIGLNNIYIAWGPFLARSMDQGISFTLTAEGPPYLGFSTISVGAEGQVYFGRSFVFNNAADPMTEPTSEHLGHMDLSGFACGGSVGPNPYGLCGQPWVAADVSNTPSRGSLYYLQSLDVQGDNDPADVMFVASADGGRTWAHPVRVNDDPLTTSAWQWFGMISVALNGRIDAAWNDTRNTGEGNLSELYYAYSLDSGVTWSQNVPVSPVFDSTIGWPVGQAKIGDYYHMISDNLGVNIAYAATFNGEQDVYFLRIGPYDCNGNESPDEDDIADGVSLDCNENDVPDECEYRGDFNGDRLTALDDYFAYTQCRTAPDVEFFTPCCGLFDIEPDGDVDLADFAFVQRAFAVPGP